MELCAETLDHLRNEALVGLCRGWIGERLATLERQREEIHSTRSPFAVFGRRETKEAFTRSVRATEESTNTLRHGLAELEQVELRLLPLIRADLETYLDNVSPEFQQLTRSVRLIEVWQRKLRELADPLLGLARELRVLRTAAPGQPMLRGIAIAREITQRLEAAHVTLSGIARDVAGALQASASDVRLPELPELRRVGWLQRLALLPVPKIQAESTPVEAETRRFLAEGLEAACAKAQSCHAVCQALADHYLEQYWSQLRAFAREHYVEEISLEEALPALTARYVDADIARYQRELALDPFGINH